MSTGGYEIIEDTAVELLDDMLPGAAFDSAQIRQVNKAVHALSFLSPDRSRLMFNAPSDGAQNHSPSHKYVLALKLFVFYNGIHA